MKNLREEVMEILDDMVYEGITFEDVVIEVLNHGCASGVVGALTYYYQTKKFFIEHMEEIFDLYNEYKNEFGELNFEVDFNSLAWFSFEEVTRQIADEMGVEY